jgi:4-amino-4-deoxy-L-arabinose transferase-like glycosyltransferase
MSGSKNSLLQWLAKLTSKKSQPEMAESEKPESDQTGVFLQRKPVEFKFSQGWWEWVVILLAVFLFCSNFLDLKADTRLPGEEAGLFQTYDWVLFKSLTQSRQFPLWNPFVNTGVSYVADPMLHAYNPVVTIPVLLFGVRVGFKLAIYFSFLLAAFGMWRLGLVLGLGGPTRVWMALMYAFAGQPVARFIQGEYLFVLAFAWFPWIFSSLFQLAYTGRRRYSAESALFLALLFFCGNGYDQFYMLLLAGIFALVSLFGVRRRSGRWSNWRVPRLNMALLGKLSVVAVLTSGMVSIHLLPMVELWPWMNKDTNVEGGQSLKQIFLDYTSKDSYRPDAMDEYPAREEFYAYIGIAPFLALVLLPLAWPKTDKRVLAFFVLMLGFVVVWIRMEAFPWYQFFLDTRFLLQFRILLRVLVFGSLALIVLAAIGLNRLWQIFHLLRERFSAVPNPTRTWRARLGYWFGTAGWLALGVFMVVSVIDLYSTHRPFVATVPSLDDAERVVGWLRQYDLSAYYARPQANNTWYEPMISQGMRYIEIWFPYQLVRSPGGFLQPRFVQAEPNYVLQSVDAPDTTFEGMEKVGQVENFNIFHLKDSLPMAFLVADADLATDAGGRWLQASDVTQVEPFFPGPNDIEVIATSDGQTFGDKLVVLTTRAPGWQLKVDGEKRELLDVGGYLAGELLPGVHRYVFSYRPKLFFIGLLLSLVCLGIVLYWLGKEVKLDRQVIRQRWQQAVEGLRHLRSQPGRWRVAPDITLEAVLRQGALHPDQPLDLAEETRLRLTIHSPSEGTNPLRVAGQRWLRASALLLKTLLRAGTLETWLFSAAILVYLSTRLVGLLDYPIYFFTDEAVQTLLAQDLLQKGLMGADGQFLPTYFANVDHYNLSTSVYLQTIPVLLFGKSAFVTRLVPMLMTLLAAVCVGLILRDIFKLSHWWTATLILSITPAWFLHSRTAFEVTLMVSLYTAGLYYYLLYRYRNPRYLYAALILLALAFYTYSPGQVVVVVTGVGLLLSDLRYHWQNRVVGFGGLGLLLVLVLPYMRFRLVHPDAFQDHLVMLNSYWIQPISLQEKLHQLWSEYTLGLNPTYWFFPNGRDLVRHVMDGYGHILRATLPLIALGLLICLKEIRSSAHRLILIALLAAPSGAAMAQMAVTRALSMVIPACLLAALGLVTLLGWLAKLRISPKFLALVTFSVLSLVNIWMLRDALVNGPTWFQDYGLGGMQYGARQLFAEVEAYSHAHPDAQLLVSPVWANGPDLLARFFLPQNLPVSLGSIGAYMVRYQAIDPQQVFVMTADEYQQVLSSGKFRDIHVDDTLPYPNGKTGFYFVNLSYVDNIQSILAGEQQLRHKLIENQVTIDGQTVKIRHSLLDMGSIQDIFDGNPHSVARTMEANPFIIELTFPEPRQISGFTMIVGDTELKLRILLYTPQAPEPVEYTFSIDTSTQNPQGTVDFPQTQWVSVFYLEIKDLRQGEPGNVHLWELTFK